MASADKPYNHMICDHCTNSLLTGLEQFSGYCFVCFNKLPQEEQQRWRERDAENLQAYRDACGGHYGG